MARLTAAARRAIPRDREHFLVPSKAPGPGSYPIIDKAHKKAAVGLAAMHGHSGIEAKAKVSLHKGGKDHHLHMAHEHLKAAHGKHTHEAMREHVAVAMEHLKAAGAHHGGESHAYDFRKD